MMIKAIAGGGGRGSRVVTQRRRACATFERCRSEAKRRSATARSTSRSSSRGAPRRGADPGRSARRHCAPRRARMQHSTALPEGRRGGACARALRRICASRSSSRGALRTQRRLRECGHIRVPGRREWRDKRPAFAFIEANARLQVEHTVTEAVTGVDIVQAQIRLAEGATIAELGSTIPRIARAARLRDPGARVHGDHRRRRLVSARSRHARRLRGAKRPGVRTDGFGYSGYRTSLSFDSLLAKVIGHSSSPTSPMPLPEPRVRSSEFRIEGVGTNIQFLQSILAHPDFATGSIHTRFVDEQITALAAASTPRRRFVEPIGGAPEMADARRAGRRFCRRSRRRCQGPAGSVQPRQPGEVSETAEAIDEAAAPDRSQSPARGTIVSIEVALDDEVAAGRGIAVIETMGLRHLVQQTAAALCKRSWCPPVM